MIKPNILMIHRISSGRYRIEEHYYSRNLVVDKKNLFDVITSLIDSGLEIGSISDALYDPNRFHLTFDDGYKEHLVIGKELKEHFSFDTDQCTFCINVGNSILHSYSGMDMIYRISSDHGIERIIQYFQKNDWKAKSDIQSIKEKFITLTPEEIHQLFINLPIDDSNMESLFLTKEEVKKLSYLFQIASHGISHRDLRNHSDISKEEIAESKKILEDIIQSEISIMCYPEGKNDDDVQRMTELSGYQYGLSINHQENNPYSIGRYCINRHLDEFMRGLNE